MSASLSPTHEIESMINLTLKTKCVLLATAPDYKSNPKMKEKDVFANVYTRNIANTGKTLWHTVIAGMFFIQK